jgi:hypothetical protein
VSRPLSLLALVVGILLGSPSALAATQAELVKKARAREAAFEPASAAALYARAIEADPGSRTAQRAKSRLDWLKARSEGDFEPLAELMRMQALRPAERTAGALRSFGEQVRTFPSGTVKRESLAYLARAYARDVGDQEAALSAYERWLAAPGLTEAERQLAESGAALSRAALGRADESEAKLAAGGLDDRAEAVMLRAARIGKQGSWVAAGLLVLFLAAGLGLGGHRGLRELKAALGARRLAVAVYLLAPPLCMVWLYDWRLLPQLAMVVGACASVMLVASIVGVGLARSDVPSGRRRLVAVLGALATLGAAFIALHRSRLLLDVMLTWEQLS